MRKLIIKLLLFFSPFILISLLVLLVDPYNLFNISKLFNDQAKIKCLNRSNASSPRGNILWKTFEFRKNPTPNIFLGDSRMMDVSNTCLSKRINGEITNLSVPAGNNQTLIDMFWMAAHVSKLKNVFIQINFNRYNALFNFDLLEPARQLMQKPFSYFLKWNYIQDAYSVLYYSLSNDEQYVNQSYKFQPDNWTITEKLITNELTRYDYVYPKKHLSEFRKIAEYCKKNEIKLVFVIAPDYSESHTFIEKYHLMKEYHQFKQDINSLGTTIDLDTGLPFSCNKKNYIDYFHVRPEIADTLVSMIFQDSCLKPKLF